MQINNKPSDQVNNKVICTFIKNVPNVHFLQKIEYYWNVYEKSEANVIVKYVYFWIC